MIAKVRTKYEKKIRAAEVSARMKRIALGLLRLRIRSRPEKEMSDEQVLAAREFHRTGDFSYRCLQEIWHVTDRHGMGVRKEIKDRAPKIARLLSKLGARKTHKAPAVQTEPQVEPHQVAEPQVAEPQVAEPQVAEPQVSVLSEAQG